MAKLCLQLAVEFDQEVIDKTGIAGVFYILFEWSPVEAPSAAAVDGGDTAVAGDRE